MPNWCLGTIRFRGISCSAHRRHLCLQILAVGECFHDLDQIRERVAVHSTYSDMNWHRHSRYGRGADFYAADTLRWDVPQPREPRERLVRFSTFQMNKQNIVFDSALIDLDQVETGWPRDGQRRRRVSTFRRLNGWLRTPLSTVHVRLTCAIACRRNHETDMPSQRGYAHTSSTEVCFR